MTKARIHKAQRLLELQRGLQRLEEGKIAGLKSRQAELATLQEDLITALNADDGPQDCSSSPCAPRNLGEETASRQELERRYATPGPTGRAKYAERRSRAYEEQHARARAQKELLEVIERAIRSEDASLP
jgi:hypothetical protein